MPKGNVTTTAYRLWMEDERMEKRYEGLHPTSGCVSPQVAVEKLLNGDTVYIRTNHLGAVQTMMSERDD